VGLGGGRRPDGEREVSHGGGAEEARGGLSGSAKFQSPLSLPARRCRTAPRPARGGAGRAHSCSLLVVALGEVRSEQSRGVKGKGSVLFCVSLPSSSSCFGGGGDEATGEANQTKTGASSSKPSVLNLLAFSRKEK